MIKTCWFATLRDIGYSTELSVTNPLPCQGIPGQSLKLQLRLFKNSYPVGENAIPIGTLDPGARINIDIEQILDNHSIQGDVVGVLNEIPSNMSSEALTQISLSELRNWTSISDEFVGYRHQKSGIKSGVHYQSSPMNDGRITSSNSIIMQSPKIVISDHVDTCLLVFAPSSDLTIEKQIPVHIAVLDQRGNLVTRTTTEIGLRERRLFSVKEILARANKLEPFVQQGGFGMMVGLAENGNIVPLSLTIDPSGGMAIDHTLPPPYYVPWWGGDARKSATRELIQRFFSMSEHS
jgi:hypothetical protein